VASDATGTRSAPVCRSRAQVVAEDDEADERRGEGPEQFCQRAGEVACHGAGARALAQRRGLGVDPGDVVVREFGEPEQWRFDWEWPYTRDQWLAVVPTFGGHAQIPPATMARSDHPAKKQRFASRPGNGALCGSDFRLLDDGAPDAGVPHGGDPVAALVNGVRSGAR
jgi:hypothetical protein